MESNDKKFKGQNFYVGIDVHKKSWKVTILNSEMRLNNFSQDPDPGLLISHLRRNYPGGNFHLVYEAGFCGFEACRAFLEAGMDAIVVHPLDVPTTGKQSKHKTDKVDSHKLAITLRGGLLKGIHVPDRETEADCDLVKQRATIVKDLGAVKNRVKGLLMKLSISIPEQVIGENASRSWSKKYVAWLEGLEFDQPSHRLVLDNYLVQGKQLVDLLDTVEDQLREVEKKECYSEDCEILRSMPGIGWVVAMNLRLHLGNVERFKRLEDLNSYIGLVPSMYSSGEKERIGALTKRGRANLREYLVEAAWIAVRKDPALTLRYTELSKRMKKNKAIIRIAKSLVSRMRHLLVNRETYKLSTYPA